ncbi:hypothetical protein HDV63DRAFT_163975 [Trichoderma sp. SZMC 28014]
MGVQEQLEVMSENDSSLGHVALACQIHLQELLREEEFQEDAAKARDGFWASRQSAEFNLWCSKVGVYGEGLRAINVRLKDVPGIFELLKQLLQSLEHDLAELLQPDKATEHVANTHGSDDDAHSDSSSLSFLSLSSSEKSEADGVTNDASASEKRHTALRSHIEDTIDRLHGHALQIDRAGAKHRRERIDLYRQKEGPKWAYEGYKEIATRAAKSYFPSASEAFRQRIGESFARRRIRFEYLAEHQKKKAVEVTLHQSQSSLAKIPSGSKGTDKPTHVSVSKEVDADTFTQSVSLDQHTVYSATVNTKLDMQPPPRLQERAQSVASVALRHPGFPPPPKFYGNSFQCPYCRLKFRAHEAGKERWSQHVIQDFEPYFCTLEECKAPFDVPNSFDGLLDHLQSHIEERYHVDMLDGKHEELDETEFEQHLAQHGDIPAELESIMKKVSRRKGPFLFESCPFCGGYPDAIEKLFSDSGTLEAQKALRKHIKQHMQDFALFLPPYREDISDEDDDLQSFAVTGQSANVEDFESLEEFPEICDQADCDCKSRGRKIADVLTDGSITITAEDVDARSTYHRGGIQLMKKLISEPGRNSAVVPIRTGIEASGLSTEALDAIMYGFDFESMVNFNSDAQKDLATLATPDDTDPDFWKELFPTSAVYDSSPVPDEYYLGDEHLRSFIASASSQAHDISPSISKIAEALSAYNPIEDSQVFQDCMSSLGGPEISTESNRVYPLAKSSCEWVFEHKEYLDWVAGRHTLLWINGRPGSGKSTLLNRLLAKHRNNTNSGTGNIVLSFSFRNNGGELQDTRRELYQSVLYQILEQAPDALPELIRTFEQGYKQSRETGEAWQWDPDMLRLFFVIAVSRICQCDQIWLFIDSLEVCSRDIVFSLTEELEALIPPSSQSSKKAHICLTCHSHIHMDRKDSLQIHPENENQGDMAMYIQDQISEATLSATNIPAIIIEKVNGNFSLAILLVEKVLELERRQNTAQAIQEEIESICPVIDLYHKLIARQGSLSWSLESIYTIDEAITQLLIDEGAETWFEETLGQPPLLWAMERGYEVAANLLLDKGAEMEVSLSPHAAPMPPSTAMVTQDGIQPLPVQIYSVPRGSSDNLTISDAGSVSTFALSSIYDNHFTEESSLEQLGPSNNRMAGTVADVQAVLGQVDVKLDKMRTSTIARHISSGSTVQRTSTVDSGNRRKVTKMLIPTDNALSNKAHTWVEDLKRSGKALDFPEIPGESWRNKDLPKIRQTYNVPRDADGNATPLPRSRSRAGSHRGTSPLPGLSPSRSHSMVQPQQIPSNNMSMGGGAEKKCLRCKTPFTPSRARHRCRVCSLFFDSDCTTNIANNILSANLGYLI